MKSLSQKRWFHGKRTFEIIDEDKVKINVSSISKSYNENVNICDLDSTHERFRTREIKWLVFTVPCLIMVFPFLYEAINLSQPVPWVLVAFFGAPAALCVQQFFHRQDDLVIFRNKRTGEAGLWFWNNKPSESELNDFVGAIEKLAKETGINETDIDNLPYLVEAKVSISSLARILAAVPFEISDIGEDYLKVKFEDLTISVTLLESMKSLRIGFAFPSEDLPVSRVSEILDEINKMSMLVKYTAEVRKNKICLVAS